MTSDRNTKASSRSRRERGTMAKAERARQRRRAGLRKRTRSFAITSAVIALVGLIGFFALSGSSSGVSFAGDLRTGGHLQHLDLPALEGSGHVDYSTYANRPLVINFFASWCPNCVGEMPGFEKVHAALGDRVAFLGISQSDDPGASIALARQTGISYDTAVDRQGSFFNAVGATGMPTTIFVRPGGEIAQIWTGALDEAALRQAVKKYLGVG